MDATTPPRNVTFGSSFLCLESSNVRRPSSACSNSVASVGTTGRRELYDEAARPKRLPNLSTGGVSCSMVTRASDESSSSRSDGSSRIIGAEITRLAARARERPASGKRTKGMYDIICGNKRFVNGAAVVRAAIWAAKAPLLGHHVHGAACTFRPLKTEQKTTC